MKRLTCAVMTLILIGFLGGTASAQTRVSDKDIETMMKNLKEDAKKFVSSYNSGVGKTVIRKTSREKESKALVKKFEQQTDGMLNNFKKNKKADAELQLVLRTAGQIKELLSEVKLDQRTVSAWKEVDDGLGLLSKSLGIKN